MCTISRSFFVFASIRVDREGWFEWTDIRRVEQTGARVIQKRPLQVAVAWSSIAERYRGRIKGSSGAQTMRSGSANRNRKWTLSRCRGTGEVLGQCRQCPRTAKDVALTRGADQSLRQLQKGTAPSRPLGRTRENRCCLDGRRLPHGD